MMSEGEEIDEGKSEVLIRVFGAPLDACGSGCGSCCDPSCGSGRSFEEMTYELARELEKTFGGRITTKYVDLSEHVHEYPQLVNAVQTGRIPLPLVMINGDVKFAGGMPLEGIIREIEKLNDG